ncbi:MAG: Rieske 2Fe-2S domain-containing protein [Rhizobiaceae bacterium]
MSNTYRPVLWNRNKYLYDAVLAIAVTVYILVFLKFAPAFHDVTRPVETPILRMRAFGSCAFLMLTIILCIGPLARLDRRFLPLLYNRRHFGVMTCIVAFIHASYVMKWYYAFSPTDRYVALLSSNVSFSQLAGFPFELLGMLTLLILIVLAVTSHDFWLSFLTPVVWKTLHMGIYVAYASLVAHVGFGYFQSTTSVFFTIVFFGSALLVTMLHLIASRGESGIDGTASNASGYLPVCRVDELENKRGRVVVLPDGERAAVFKYDGKISALSNLCAHQNGPLGEGRMLYGCVTCPWHGYQYRPEDGCSPPPFTEKVPTYNLALNGDELLIDPVANPAGTYVEPLQVPREREAQQ